MARVPPMHFRGFERGSPGAGRLPSTPPREMRSPRREANVAYYHASPSSSPVQHKQEYEYVRIASGGSSPAVPSSPVAKPSPERADRGKMRLRLVKVDPLPASDPAALGYAMSGLALDEQPPSRGAGSTANNTPTNSFGGSSTTVTASHTSLKSEASEFESSTPQHPESSGYSLDGGEGAAATATLSVAAQGIIQELLFRIQELETRCAQAGASGAGPHGGVPSDADIQGLEELRAAQLRENVELKIKLMQLREQNATQRADLSRLHTLEAERTVLANKVLALERIAVEHAALCAELERGSGRRGSGAGLNSSGVSVGSGDKERPGTPRKLGRLPA